MNGSQLKLVSTLALALSMGIATAARAETPTTMPATTPTTADAMAIGTTPATSEILSQVNTLSKEGRTRTAQVTSVSQLSDVRPTDWAFTSLQSLVERYGCIAGYPDKTYRGGQSMTRYEFAAGLNACLDKVNEIISAGLADKVSKEDLSTLQKLQEEFASELATLRGRVGTLEDKTAKLEAQQFSTTTKLSGAAFFNITGATAGDNLLDPRGRATTKPNTTFSSLVWLTLNTSFTGKDSLITQLAVGNGDSPVNRYVDPDFSTGFYNSTGTPFLDQTAGATANQFILRELSYTFPVFNTATLVVGPRVNFYKYFDGNRFTFPLSGGTTSFNSINSTLLTNAKRGAGAVFMTPLGDKFDFKVGFLAESNEFLPGSRSASDPNQGLFGGNNALTAEIGFKPSDAFNLRLLYSRTNSQGSGGTVGGVGATPSLPGVADGGGVALANGQSNIFAANFDWLLTKGFGLFGRYGISDTNLNRTTGGSVGNVTVQTFQVGAAFPDLFKEGASATVSLVMPFDYTAGRSLMASGAARGVASGYSPQYDLELAYFYPLTKNIALHPSAYLIFNPNNISGNPTIFVGSMRLQFLF